MIGTADAIRLAKEHINKKYSKVTILKLMRACKSFIMSNGLAMVDETEFTNMYLNTLATNDCYKLLLEHGIKITLNETRQLVQASQGAVKRGSRLYISKEAFNMILQGMKHGKEKS